MSTPSSDGRRSLSSGPSGSSHTLHSTPPGPRIADRSPHSASQGAGSSPLGPEAIDEHDFAHRRHRARAGGGFLLESALPRAPRRRASDAKGKSRARPSDADEQPARRRRASPGHDTQERARLRVPKPREAPAPPAVDPNQLVHMALNLSESRRRNISASQLLRSPSRVASAAQRDGSFSNAGVGSSLRQYLNEQRRVSRNMSPLGTSASPRRHMSASMQSGGSMAAMPWSPSPATLLRRDKARAYIELRAAYMRLLDILPPLKADANAPGNFIYSYSAVPGSPHAHLTRTPSYANKKNELGRPYNPLQALRNRRSRARERLALPQEPVEFSQCEQVLEWVEQIEEQARTPGYRLEDRVSLPRLHHDLDMQDVQTKPTKTQQGWSFTPEELLADAYWLEQGDNKAVIEDRNGRKIFPPREPPKQKSDFLQPRSSKEYSDKRRRSWVDGTPGTDPTTGDESEQGSERGRKRRLLPHIRAESRLRKGRGSPRKHSIGHSDSSDTDDDARKVRKSFDVENTGPLALQMKRQLELQTRGINNASPAFTPDTPDKWGRLMDDIPDGKISRNSLEVPRFANGVARPDENATLKMPPRTRTNPLSPIKSAEPRSSYEDDSTAPSTPPHVRQLLHTWSDLSPPPSRAGSDFGKSKRSKLNPFHSTHDLDHDLKQEARSSLDKKQHSRQPSEDEPSGIGNAIFAAPGAVKNLLGHRKNDSVSSLPSPEKSRRKETQDPKDGHSAVTRFFKGVKHEGTKVGDIIFRRDRADDTDASTISDRNSLELDDDSRNKPTLSRTVTSTTAGSVTSEDDGRNQFKLPSFRPIHETLNDDDDVSDSEHHISRQARERRDDRSARIDRLLPPRMDLQRVSSASSTATLAPAQTNEDRISQQLARSGGVFASALPPTGLKDRSASRPTLEGKRHWSIADSDDEHALPRRPHSTVTAADIARVRALFLCSGVKAKEIARRAHAPNPHTPAFLVRAAHTAKQSLFPVPRKEEHVLAARILVHDLEHSATALHTACAAFRAGAAADTRARIEALRDDLDTDVLPRIFEAGDAAVRTTTQASGPGALLVKQLADEVERMLRQRRRHSRWVMSWAWSLVEWAIVVALRVASVVFAVYGLLKSGVGVVWAVVRWLLWL
ncbi:hypothetical protein C7974DRAFT_363715 [Boeremia exigua]|uniref:uncharacterized protein n=1 Tax=Boeremia exigua TaxID=749465 RepID=UPI001E8CFA69|nr:uncharacterized protein C7974DRAFT_363715 [Boeremia exigua]KAH6620283.1 hypothetical protein C7974DRAFT_363715 [Boeremia exigua]